jgi:hypothetical protein
MSALVWVLPTAVAIAGLVPFLAPRPRPALVRVEARTPRRAA